MINIIILTIFPNIFDSIIKYGIINKAIKNNKLNIKLYNIRNFSKNKYKSIDDYQYGGGKGMVMKFEPIYYSLLNAKKDIGYNSYVIYLSPKGKIINNLDIIRLSNKKSIILLCGRYEGIDNRIMNFINEEISIGDYVLSGGEIPAMVLLDLISRNIYGVLNSYESIKNDSFFNNLLDYPSYTRPRKFMNIEVPNVLLSGNHKNIYKWRLIKSIEYTINNKPYLLYNRNFSNEENKIIKSFKLNLDKK
ncbi:tRNA (guanosine(37)-N1)-methyltransferase TrmD [endosymbiont of Pachyrhynchus infernalis]|uniref:tRNA (guanosine(37)-N1)-methyltransferase TrmD n=1 Tax=endosymbiont of Pachyrhynchus infernalis TaxID=1971488 RepID=UPI000DC71D2B|nr:tRNA (guanosine(37)-N1)-methyltransferase TrmD [endosymbiont of Pachyrhynchus infernalis]BBA84881.1 tRNA (guanine-N(1)-)-methyltransferase [endosymbiont of Pachyrhynchus infernalis]